MDEVAIPRYIDAQQQFFMWEMDEAAVAISLFGMGIIIGSMLSGIVALVVVNHFLRRFKNESLDGALLHIAYWNGLFGLNKGFQDSFEREFYA